VITVQQYADGWKIVQLEKGKADNPDKQLWEIRKIDNEYSIQSKHNGAELIAVGDDPVLLQLSTVKKERWQIIPEIFSKEQVKEDVDFYIKTLEEAHPNPYFKMSKDSILKAMYAIVDEAPMGKKRFHVMLAQINRFFDGHSGVYFDLNTINRYSKKESKYFPELASITESTVFLQNNQHGLVNISTINEQPIESILRKINNVISLESQDYKNCLIQSRFSQYLLHICDINAPFHITGTNSKGAVDYTIAGIDEETLEEQRIKIPENRNKHPLRSFFYDADSIAVLQYNTCVLEQLGDMDKFLTDFFAQAEKKKIQYLFIDITSNGGGSSGANYNVIKYLQHGEVREAIKTTMKIDQYIKRYGEIKEKQNINNRNQTYTFYYNGVTPAKTDGFSGDVFLLQSRFTYSAADNFSGLVKRNWLATIIGEPTGQPLRGYIDSKRTFLPNSGIHFGCSVKEYETLGIDCSTESVCPDIPFTIGCEIPDEFPKEQLKDFIARAKMEK
jgi:hypothetical protein